MRRVGNILLAVLAVLVVVGAVYAIGHDGSSHGASGSTPGAAPATTSTPAPSDTASPTGSTSSRSTSSGSSGKPVIAFLGDDWTTGAGASKPSKRFSTLLCKLLDADEVNLGAAGTGYAKTSSPGGDYASRVAQVVAAKPTVVVITGGRNDVTLDPDTVSADARTLLQDLTTQLPDATILVVAPFWGDSDHPSTLDAVTARVRAAAEATGATYLNIADPIHNHPSWMADAADPNDTGYAAVAEALLPQLRTALNP